jgi:hypothetical protein
LHLTPALVAHEPLLVVNKLAFGKLVDNIAEFNSAYSSVVLAVLPHDLVTDKSEGLAMHVIDLLRLFLGRDL